MIAALSGRALAAAARRAGYRPLVADLFRDADTRRLAGRSVLVPATLQGGFTEPALEAAMGALCGTGEPAPLGLVYGAGFEDRPALLDRLARRMPLLGNDPATVARIKDPAIFFPLLDELSVPHPEVRFARPDDPRGWLAKAAGASGGGHVRPAGGAAALSPGAYYQRRVAGRPISALFLADGARAKTLGFSLQWRSASGPRGTFRFGGVVRPAPVPEPLIDRMQAAVARVAAAFGLRGLNGADFLVRGTSFDLLEVNPRPGATLDLFDRRPEAPLFALHRAACEGALPDDWTAPRGAAACAVAYARRAVTVPGAWRWPRWCADRPPAGTRIRRGEPLCTLLARAPTAEAARCRVLEREAWLLGQLGAARTGSRRAGETASAPLAM